MATATKRYCYVAVFITLIIIFIVYVNNLKSGFTDRFITISNLNETDDTIIVTNKLINLTNFEYVIKSNVCRNFHDEIKGKLFNKHDLFFFSNLN